MAVSSVISSDEGEFPEIAHTVFKVVEAQSTRDEVDEVPCLIVADFVCFHIFSWLVTSLYKQNACQSEGNLRLFCCPAVDFQSNRTPYQEKMTYAVPGFLKSLRYFFICLRQSLTSYI